MMNIAAQARQMLAPTLRNMDAAANVATPTRQMTNGVDSARLQLISFLLSGDSPPVPQHVAPGIRSYRSRIRPF